jgi:hypothetical protein
MTVFVYLNTAKLVATLSTSRCFANVDAAENGLRKTIPKASRSNRF